MERKELFFKCYFLYNRFFFAKVQHFYQQNDNKVFISLPTFCVAFPFYKKANLKYHLKVTVIECVKIISSNQAVLKEYLYTNSELFSPIELYDQNVWRQSVSMPGAGTLWEIGKRNQAGSVPKPRHDNNYCVPFSPPETKSRTVSRIQLPNARWNCLGTNL